MSRSPSTAPLPAQVSPLEVAKDLLDNRTNLQKIEQAVRQSRVLLAFQPIVNARDPRRILAFEAFSRIPDELGRVIPAGEFIDKIENDELGRILDTEVLRLCIQKLNRNQNIRISMNMSARSIGHQPWIANLQDAIKRNPGIAKRLTLEMTEDSVYLVPEFVTMFMREMRHTGLKFALDNFGSGKTSFNSFKKFMFDFVKLDQSLTSDIPKNPDTEVLVQAIVAFCQEFDLVTVADKIETPEQFKILQRIGVGFMQGFLLGEPKLDKG